MSSSRRLDTALEFRPGLICISIFVPVKLCKKINEAPLRATRPALEQGGKARLNGSPEIGDA